MGLIVGDAMGVPVEFNPRDSFKVSDMIGYGTYDLPAGSWSDDSSMMLATVESIARLGEIDTDDIMKNFVRWVNDGEFTPYGELFDIGRATRNAIQRYVQGIPAEQCGGTAEWDNGNGSLMRILPLAFLDCDYETVNAVSSLTHAHEISIAACRVYVYIARQLFHGKTLEEIYNCFGMKQSTFERLPILKDLTRDEIKSTGYVVDTLEAALWCNLNSSSFRECILLAVNLGDDTDTVAAVAGGLAGIIYGVGGERGIPEEWINQLAKKEWIADLCGKFEKCLGKEK
jgi:ADP-ribosylglycohydrolase